MLYTQRKQGRFTLEPTELHSVLNELPATDWQPAILGQRHYFLRLAGIPENAAIDIRPSRRSPRMHRLSEGSLGDLVFRDDHVLYIVLGGSENIYVDPSGRVIRTGPDRTESTVEIGAIGTDPKRVSAGLEEFSAAIELAVRASFDGRRVRHMELAWADIAPETIKLERILRLDDENAGPAFVPAELIDAEVAGSRSLSDNSTRELLRLISEAVFARQKELLERRGRKQEEIRETLRHLQDADLVATEYLLECKRSNTRLSRFRSAEELADEKVGSLVCASCGARFRDEALHEGYSVSDMGRRLIRGSHWMTIQITELLVKLGMPRDAIVWNVSEGGEEVDIIADFLDQLWIFELKDREFGAGDAHPFNYRRVRYGADRAIVISTERVSKDAKRVFDELRREDNVGRRAEIIYVEGLNNAANVLQQEISKAGVQYARRRLAILSDVVGYDLAAILSAKFKSTLEGDSGLFGE